MAGTRAALEARVDALAQELTGPALVEQIRLLAAELDEHERALLGEILLERAGEEGAFDEGPVARIEAKGWLRRQWDALDRTTQRPR